MPPAPTSIPSRLGTEDPSSVNTPDTLADDPPPYVEPPSARDVDDLVTYIREASADQDRPATPPGDDDQHQDKQDQEDASYWDASYWDAAAMAPLSARSAVCQDTTPLDHLIC